MVRVLSYLRGGGGEGKRRWSRSSKWCAWSWPRTDTTTAAAAMLVPGKWVWEHLTLLRIFQSQLRLWKKYMESCYPMNSLETKSSGDWRRDVCFTRMHTHPEGKWKTYAWKNISWQLLRFSLFIYQKATSEEKVCTTLPASRAISNKQQTESSASLPQFYWPGASLHLCVLFTRCHRAMGSLSVAGTPTYLSSSIYSHSFLSTLHSSM